MDEELKIKKKINYEKLFLQNEIDIILENIDFGNIFDFYVKLRN